ncbi:MAG TPA: type II secretion system protein GspG [Xanthomonadales bacterium]|nr:type II secretion system protein GspG [Xanthomonadales bacterium]
MNQEVQMFSLDGLRVRVLRALASISGRGGVMGAGGENGADSTESANGTGRLVSASRRVGVHQQGFSLIEMLLVLGIIAFIATMLATNIFKGKGKADVKSAQAGVRKVATSVDQYYLDSGSIPAKIEDLVTRPGNVTNWGGPYLTESQLKDPWGTNYVIKVPGEGGQPYAVISLGSDKTPGGADTAADIDNNQ